MGGGVATRNTGPYIFMYTYFCEALDIVDPVLDGEKPNSASLLGCVGCSLSQVKGARFTLPKRQYPNKTMLDGFKGKPEENTPL